MKTEQKKGYTISNNYDGIDKYASNIAALYTAPITPFIRPFFIEPLMPLEKPLPPLIREIPPLPGSYKPKIEFPWMEEKRVNDFRYRTGL